jgi:transposase
LREKLGLEDIARVKEISMDMSPTMESITNTVFSCHYIVTDRFHVMKNTLEDINAIKTRLKSIVKREESEKEKICKQL